MSLLRSRSYALLAALLLLLGAAPLRADMAQAASFYKTGRVKMTAKDYHGAIADFTASLAAEPRYVFSQRERATCKYYLGDKAGALADYSAYSKANPKDVKTAALVKKLEAAGVQAAPVAAAAAGAAGRPKWGLSLGGGYNTYAMTDWNEGFSGSSSTSSGGTIGSGFDLGLKLGWRVAPKVLLDLFEFGYLMASSQRKGTGYTTDYNLPAMWVGVGGAYVMPLGSSLDLRLGAGLGYLLLSGGGTSKSTATSGSGSTSSITYTGAGFGFKLFAGLDYFLSQHFALGLDLGYRLASVSPVVYTGTGSSGVTYSGTLQKYNAQTGMPSGNVAIDYSGVLAKFGLSYWF